MKNAAPALLIVTMEPPPAMEEEFNDWYDTEHFPQRRALPGFLSGSRWVCLDGWPRYLALYELNGLSALETPEYRAVSDLNSTPWSQRVMPRTTGRQRLVCVEENTEVSSDAAMLPEVETARLLLAGWPATNGSKAAILAATLKLQAAKLPGARQVRVYRVHSEQPEVWLIATFDRPVAIAQLSDLGHVEGCGANTFNLYAPYRRKRYAPSMA
jgi:hypothetical protein